MLKRTHGRLLITLLVITGLAGTLNTSSISHKERKFAINLLKESRTGILKSTEDLSNAQLNFKLNSQNQSIKQFIYQLSAQEKNLWDLMASIMKTGPNPEKRTLIKHSDDQLVAWIGASSSPPITSGFFSTNDISFKTIKEAINFFQEQRTNHIKYLKLSTEDLRDHVVQMPFGWIDCYQLTLFIGAQSNWYINQIEKLKLNPDFPSR